MYISTLDMTMSSLSLASLLHTLYLWGRWWGRGAAYGTKGEKGIAISLLKISHWIPRIAEVVLIVGLTEKARIYKYRR